MLNCLRADFSRLFKSRFFWILILFHFGEGVLYADSAYNGLLDSKLLGVAPEIMLLGAIFLAYFIGTDHSDGTIRNKLIVGRSRAAVFFSNLVVGIAAVVLTELSFLISLIGTGLILGQSYRRTAGELAFRLLVENVALLAAVAVFVLVALLIKNRSASVVAATLLALGLLLAAMFAEGRLAEPEYYQGMVFIDEEGNLQYDNETKEANPYYLTGTPRRILEVVYDVLPSGAMIQMTSNDEEVDRAHGGLLLLCSGGIFAAAVVIGVAAFQRSDLK
ncbi:MAG: ABC transporter permease [Bacteroides sp.]|nr:ABC transporter permease [Eubacterium sp.]MCM1419668.1 ABC transporter permease [Roseburia sp.]MCM1463637.1 ABC transporter permease [Bacteroides sp.]